MKYIIFDGSKVYHVAGRPTALHKIAGTSKTRCIIYSICKASYCDNRFVSRDKIVDEVPLDKTLCKHCHRKLNGIITDEQLEAVLFLEEV